MSTEFVQRRSDGDVGCCCDVDRDDVTGHDFSSARVLRRVSWQFTLDFIIIRQNCDIFWFGVCFPEYGVRILNGQRDVDAISLK